MLNETMRNEAVEFTRSMLSWLQTFSEAENINEGEEVYDFHLENMCSEYGLDIELIEKYAIERGLFQYMVY